MPLAPTRASPARTVRVAAGLLAVGALVGLGWFPHVAQSALDQVVPEAKAEKPNRRAWLGVRLKNGPAGGVLAKRVIRNSPAAQGGIKNGDLITSVDGERLGKVSQLIARVALVGPGNSMTLGVRRGDKDRVVKVELAPHPGADAILKMDKVGTFAPKLGGEIAAVSGSLPSDISKLRGRVVLLDFWASWCGPCRLIVPHLSELHDELGAQGLSVVGITSDSVKVASRTARSWEMTYNVASDVKDETAASYGVGALPTMFLIDKRGVIREVFVGFHPAQGAVLKKKIKALLAEPAPTK